MVLNLVPILGEVMDSVCDIVSCPSWRKESNTCKCCCHQYIGIFPEYVFRILLTLIFIIKWIFFSQWEGISAI